MSSGKMVKALKIGDRVLRLETDFSLDEITKITARYKLNALFFLSTPEFGTGEGLADLYRLGCEKAGVEVPAVITFRMVSEALIDVEDDLPEYYEDGDPKGATIPLTE